MSSIRARSKRPIEYSILYTATLCLLALGAVMVYSASSAESLLNGSQDPSFYLKRYMMFGLAGLVALHVASRYGLMLVERLTPPLLMVAFALTSTWAMGASGVARQPHRSSQSPAGRWASNAALERRRSRIRRSSSARRSSAAPALESTRSRSSSCRGPHRPPSRATNKVRISSSVHPRSFARAMKANLATMDGSYGRYPAAVRSIGVTRPSWS